MDFEKHIARAKVSSWGLKKLNLGLWFMIPFNKPHRIKIKKLEDDLVITQIPYKRKNMNHIKGIHACGLATCAEFASGLLLLTKLNAKKYRLIMQSLDMEYLYQAKSDITAEFSVTDDWIKTHVLDPLVENDHVMVKCEIKLYDKDRNQVAVGHTNWQIKDWESVKTKL
ncbi:MAG: YiiD C-terminal domain-containing protein [Crocinitomicaceae bacterium]|nr:YiiD C-terminal domain-containing protein [Crocinitomicaceae bacterium]